MSIDNDIIMCYIKQPEEMRIQDFLEWILFRLSRKKSGQSIKPPEVYYREDLDPGLRRLLRHMHSIPPLGMESAVGTLHRLYISVNKKGIAMLVGVDQESSSYLQAAWREEKDEELNVILSEDYSDLSWQLVGFSLGSYVVIFSDDMVVPVRESREDSEVVFLPSDIGDPLSLLSHDGEECLYLRLLLVIMFDFLPESTQTLSY